MAWPRVPQADVRGLERRSKESERVEVEYMVVEYG